jgi:hypothetical protein
MRLIITTALICILAACKKKESIPDNVMPRDKMEAVLWDMMRADQFLVNFVLRNDSGIDRRAESIRLYQQVLAIHSISKEDLEKSLNYYKTHPLLMKDIMDSLSRATTIAPTLPVLIPDTVKPVGEERIVAPITDTVRPAPKRRPAPLPAN